MKTLGAGQDRYSGEDLIDFPCSETWLAYYYERGLTPRHPVILPSHIASLERRIWILEARQARQERQLWPVPQRREPPALPPPRLRHQASRPMEL